MTSRAIIWMMIMTDLNKVAPEVTEEELDAQLPKPVGYRILVALPEVEDTYGDSGIIKSSKEMHNDHIMSIMGLVLDMGDGAYSDKERFPTGPWCKTGDYVMFRMNTGTRFKVGGVEYRLMNDDSIEATVTDPRGISRA
jgi:co-chaperonin GroES (HSP10)|tara:strand:- start:256 stop:672 length:417 start_codon:yes stop_codon:yes gene_type:complete